MDLSLPLYQHTQSMYFAMITISLLSPLVLTTTCQSIKAPFQTSDVTALQSGLLQLTYLLLLLSDKFVVTVDTSNHQPYESLQAFNGHNSVPEASRYPAASHFSLLKCLQVPSQRITIRTEETKHTCIFEGRCKILYEAKKEEKGESI
jgi:hypothetical protein